MPYLTKDRKELLRQNPGLAATTGDLNFLITTVMLNIFKDHPRYEMIHILGRDFLQDHKHNPVLNALRSDFADRFSVGDIYAASSLAFLEFYRVVGAFYENKKIAENGNVEEYQAVLDMLNAPKEQAEPVVVTAPMDPGV